MTFQPKEHPDEWIADLRQRLRVRRFLKSAAIALLAIAGVCVGIVVLAVTTSLVIAYL